MKATYRNFEKLHGTTPYKFCELLQLNVCIQAVTNKDQH